ncbi:ATP-binding cassette domain-containing protein [Streptomyces sp. HNM0663]|uniref:ATP-binding cassette domain-containing protein n=1 Tax=Streptomyces chengmaiensis TaxID=3040919 RepID=A0ABT6HVW2_9ACTN|nr:ATP-binding cassette domain-containing protein [Streptomyces chengmaiensis]MDH2392857.1 ATP-binding cassette domain-containing protein [Streptomyces chengmaiensis]
MASLTYDLTLAGLAVGSAAALTGIGLIVTYRATGVLNLAHGAIAMVCAYVLLQLAVEWDWPLPLAAAVTLGVVAPGIGLLLERLVFRPLSVLGVDPARSLVASIGVFVLLVGGAAAVWGEGARADAPELLPDNPWTQLTAAVLLAVLVASVTRWTRFGRELRAVVDNRPLAVLGGIDADRVAAAGWAFGSFTAGLTGVLLAPFVRLDPYGLPLLVVEVIAVAVIARMRSLPVAVGAALAIGVAQAQLTRLHPRGWGEPLLQAVGANLFAVALLIAALVLPGVGAGASPAPPAAPAVRVPPGVWLVAAILFLLPLGFAGRDLHTAVQVPALAVILLSLTVVTGRGGQISLGQAAYAGLGALFTALLATGRFPEFPALPELLALLTAVLLTAPLGLLTGWPAIGRRGLALALATLAVGVAVSRFVFVQPYATAGLRLTRPEGFADDRRYYMLELGVLACALLAVGALRRGRTGRALAAMRDHEAGAEGAGVPVSALKLFAFVTGAALAALGGGLLAMGVRAFDPEAFDPVRSLLWFAAVMVLGADGLLAPLAAAVLLVGLDAGPRGGLAAAAVGFLAVLIGRLPEGLPGALRRLRPPPPGGLTPIPETGGEPRADPPRGKGGSGLPSGAPGTAASPRRRTMRRLRPARGGEPAPPRRARPPQEAAPRGRASAGGRRLRFRSGSGERPAPAAAERSRRFRLPLPPRGVRVLAPGLGAGRGGGGNRRAPGEAAGRPPASHRLVARDVRLRYEDFTALDGVDLSVASGQVTALVGANGAGKSTLFHCLCGTLRPDAGRVELDGADITRRSAHARTRLGIARTFQQLAVFPSLTVEENVRIGAEQQRRRRRDPAAVEPVLRLLELDGPIRDRIAAGLSTGALRRVELGRALAGRPHTLLLDEPTAGLDAAEAEALARILMALAADGTAVLIVEHDLDLVARVADTVHVMEAGRIVR